MRCVFCRAYAYGACYGTCALPRIGSLVRCRAARPASAHRGRVAAGTGDGAGGSAGCKAVNEPGFVIQLLKRHAG